MSNRNQNREDQIMGNYTRLYIKIIDGLVGDRKEETDVICNSCLY